MCAYHTFNTKMHVPSEKKNNSDDVDGFFRLHQKWIIQKKYRRNGEARAREEDKNKIKKCCGNHNFKLKNIKSNYCNI